MVEQPNNIDNKKVKVPTDTIFEAIAYGINTLNANQYIDRPVSQEDFKNQLGNAIDKKDVLKIITLRAQYESDLSNNSSSLARAEAQVNWTMANNALLDYAKANPNWTPKSASEIPIPNELIKTFLSPDKNVFNISGNYTDNFSKVVAGLNQYKTLVYNDGNPTIKITIDGKQYLYNRKEYLDAFTKWNNGSFGDYVGKQDDFLKSNPEFNKAVVATGEKTSDDIKNNDTYYSDVKNKNYFAKATGLDPDTMRQGDNGIWTDDTGIQVKLTDNQYNNIKIGEVPVGQYAEQLVSDKQNKTGAYDAGKALNVTDDMANVDAEAKVKEEARATAARAGVVSYYADLGIKPSQEQIDTGVESILKDKSDSPLDAWKATTFEKLKPSLYTMYPQWKEDINNGHTPKDLASPYIAALADLYGVSVSSIDLTDSALSPENLVDANGKPKSQAQFMRDERGTSAYQSSFAFVRSAGDVIGSTQRFLGL